jgi:hypothetical protein
MIYLDLHPAYRRMLVVSRTVGVPLILDRVGGPYGTRIDPINDPHSQFEPESVDRKNYVSPVASRHCVNRSQINGPLDGQGCLNPGNGQVIDSACSAYVPVIENTAYLTISVPEQKSQKLSNSFREGVCLND